MNLTKVINSIFSYREPKNTELGFELTEDAQDGKSESSGTFSQSEKSHGVKSEKASKSSKAQKQPDNSGNNTEQYGENEGILSDIDTNIKAIESIFNMSKNNDVVIRNFKLAKRIRAALVFIEGMVDKQILNRDVLPKLMSKDEFDELTTNSESECPIDYVIESVLCVHKVLKEKKMKKVTASILNGFCALIIDGCRECLLLDVKGFEKRNIEQPITETVVIGSHEGFTENLRTNLTLLHRMIKNQKLVIEMIQLEEANNTNCAVVYLDGVANQKVIDEVKRRIKSVKTDFISGSGMLEQFVEDSPFMLFPQVLTTERPDRAASFIMEGYVVFFAEGSAFAKVAPITFFSFMHTAEDSILRWQYGTFLRFIRFSGLFIATLLPGIYVGLILFHPEMVPTELLSSIVASKEQVPFPTILEVLLLEMSFELIREGSIRVPGVIGQTLGIIGALILGQAAVEAKLVSPVLIIIVAVTGIGSFTIPSYQLGLGVRILRFFYILCGAVAGFYGISAGLILIAGFMCSMKSFGVPFLSPVAPKTRASNDLLIMRPAWMQKQRPDFLNTQEQKRQSAEPRGWITQDKKAGGSDGENK